MILQTDNLDGKEPESRDEINGVQAPRSSIEGPPEPVI